jgi:hypothetical protein
LRGAACAKAPARDPSKVGWAIAITFICSQPIAVLALYKALKSAREIALEAEAWEAA